MFQKKEKKSLYQKVYFNLCGIIAIVLLITPLDILATEGSNESFVVYERPGEIVKKSPIYTVNISQNNAKEESFVYFSEPPEFDKDDPKNVLKTLDDGTIEYKPNDGAKTYRENKTTQNWTTFSLEGKALVTVTRQEPFETVKVTPSRYGIVPTISEDKRSVTFEMEPKQKVFVDFDNELKDRLYIFADPLELQENVPDKNAENVFVVGLGGEQYGDEPGCLDGLKESHTVLYFPKGVHSIEQYGQPLLPSEVNEMKTRVGYKQEWSVPEHIEQIYIEGGSAVIGGFKISRDGMKINGRGIITGETLKFHQLNLIEFEAGVKNGYVEGITLADGPHYSLRSWGAHYDGENFKVLANWRFNNDGINLTEGSVVKNCYISGNDDTVKLYFSNSTMENCVIGQMINGAIFQFGWGYRDVSNIKIKNIDIVHMDGYNANANIGVINYRPRNLPFEDRDYTIKNIIFENITVETSAPRLLYLGLPEHQNIKNMTIRNVQLKEGWYSPDIKNAVKGSTDKSAPGVGKAESINLINIKVGDEILNKDNLTTVGNFEEIGDTFINSYNFDENNIVVEDTTTQQHEQPQQYQQHEQPQQYQQHEQPQQYQQHEQQQQYQQHEQQQ